MERDESLFVRIFPQLMQRAFYTNSPLTSNPRIWVIVNQLFLWILVNLEGYSVASYRMEKGIPL